MSSPQENLSPVDLSESDLHFRQAQRSFQSADYASALLSINRAISTAEPEIPAAFYAFRANVRLMTRDYAAAEQDASQAIQAGMDDGRTLAIRATARANQHRWSQAMEDLARAIDLETRNRDQYIRLAEEFLGKASEYFRQKIIGGDQSAELFYERGLVYFHAGRHDKARRDFSMALEHDPNFDLARLGIARLDLNDKEYETVIRSVTPLVKRAAPIGEEALLLRAQARLGLGDRYQVTRDLARLRKRVANDPTRLISIANLSVQVGDPVRAIADMTRLLKERPAETEAYRVRADGYREIQNYSAAIQDYSRYLRRRPDHHASRIHRGRCYLKSGNIDLSLQDFDRVLEADPNNIAAMVGRAQAFVARDDLAAALSECERAAALDNQVEEVHATAGDIYFRLCEYSRAIDEYVRAQRLATRGDRVAHYYFLRGTALAQLNLWDEALRCFRKSVRRDPQHAGAYVWMASIYARQEEWEKAIESLEQAMRSRPGVAKKYWELGKPVAQAAINWFDKLERRNEHSTRLYRSRGLAWHFLNQPRRALRDLDWALRHDDDPATRIRHGRCLAELGEHEKAIRDFTRVIRRQDALGHEARYWRARSLVAIGNLQHALTDAIKAIRTEPAESRYYVLYGELLVAKGWHKQALRAFGRAIQFDPDDPEAYFHRGRTLLQQGNVWRAIGDLTRALELAPANPEWWVLRGQAHLRGGDANDALRDFDQAIARDDRCVEAFVGRGLALAKQDPEAALIWLTKSLQRFTAAEDRALLLFHRGKLFFDMDRPGRAINDFSAAIDLRRHDIHFVVKSRAARARALFRKGEMESAIKDLRRILRAVPTHAAARDALAWLTADQPSPKPPALLRPPMNPQTPHRPPVVREPRSIQTQLNGGVESPLDMLIVKTPDKREYGPVAPSTLLKWAGEGRLAVNTQVLRVDWSQWKRVDRLLPELALRDGEVDDFPGIDTRQTPGQATPDPSA